MNYPIAVLQAAVQALTRAGIHDQRVTDLKRAIRLLSL